MAEQSSSGTDTGAQQARPKLGALIEKSLELPTVPAIAARVIQAIEDPDLSAAGLTKIIQTDQGISARIIKICNSSLYGLTRQVSNLQSAVALLGFLEVRDLVVSASTRYLYKRFGELEKRIWEHSVAVALGSHALAKMFAPRWRDVAFLTGQMHDVGKVVMNNGDPKKFLEATKTLVTEGSCAAEQRLFGFTHTDVGAILAQRWNMPPGVEAACLYHHEFSLVQSLAPDSAPLVACVVVANLVCHRLGIGWAEEPCTCEEDGREALAALRIDESRLKAITADVGSKLRSELIA